MKTKMYLYEQLKRRDDGIVVSGAKTVGTAAALTNYNFVANYGPMDLGDGDQSHALIFFVPMNAPGVKMISRQSYELNATTDMVLHMIIHFPAALMKMMQSLCWITCLFLGKMYSLIKM